VKRQYSFSDAMLLQLTDSVISNGTRDTVQLDPEGVTLTRLAALKTLNNNFLNMEDDVEWKGLVSIKTEEKNAALEVCETASNKVRRMAENTFGEGRGKYNRFDFDGINRLQDVLRIRAYHRIHRRATANAIALAAEGLTPAFLTAFKDACLAADDAYDVTIDTIENRDEAKEERIALGNLLYAEVLKICNTGKSYWIDKSESRYNDYVISASGINAG